MKVRSHLLPLPLMTLVVTGFVSVSALSLSTEVAWSQGSEPVKVPIMRTPIEDAEAAAPLHPKDYPQGMLFPYSLLDSALSTTVDRTGNVNYLALKDSKYLDLFLQAVAHADLSQFPVFDVYVTDPKTGRESKVSKDRSPELVFWINAYNGIILNAIADAYPIKSIDEIKDFETAKVHTVAGQKYSLEDLREKVKSFGDPRALFALPSGTAGGFLPSPTAVRWSEYDARMNSAVSVFVNDPRNVRLNRIQNRVTLNPAFREVDEIMKPDSRRKGEGIKLALSGYTEQRANRSYFTTNDFQIEYGTGNRNINDKTNNPNFNPTEVKD